MKKYKIILVLIIWIISYIIFYNNYIFSDKSEISLISFNNDSIKTWERIYSIRTNQKNSSSIGTLVEDIKMEDWLLIYTINLNFNENNFLGIRNVEWFIEFFNNWFIKSFSFNTWIWIAIKWESDLHLQEKILIKYSLYWKENSILVPLEYLTIDLILPTIIPFLEYNEDWYIKIETIDILSSIQSNRIIKNSQIIYLIKEWEYVIKNNILWSEIKSEYSYDKNWVLVWFSNPFFIFEIEEFNDSNIKKDLEIDLLEKLSDINDINIDLSKNNEFIINSYNEENEWYITNNSNLNEKINLQCNIILNDKN